MITSFRKLRLRLFISSLVFLLIFILSGCNQDDVISNAPGPDTQIKDGADDQQTNADDDATSTPIEDPQASGNNGNQPPKAMIAEPEAFTSGQTVTLDGSSSSDPDGDTLTYLWTQELGPNITLSDISSSKLTFVAPMVTQATQFTFQLTVNDGELFNSATVIVQVSPIVDDKSPAIVSKSPQPDQSGVSTTAEISVGFDEALLQASVDDQSLLLSQNGSEVPGAVSYDSDSKTIINKPASALASNATYTVTLASTIKDLAGNAFAGESWAFSTGTGMDSGTNTDWTNADPKEVVKSGNPGNAKLENYADQEIGNPTIGLEGTGTAREITGPIVVPPGVVYDGKGEKLTAKGMGNGSQDEEQQPYFILLPGAELKNVTLTAPGCEGVHMMGDNRLYNVVWEDVGEDAASIRSYFPGGTIRVTGGSVNSASDKVFQLNAISKIIIKDFKATNISKLVRQNEDIPIEVVLDNVTATNVKTALVMCNTSDCTLMKRDVSGSPLTRGPVQVIDWVEGASD